MALWALLILALNATSISTAGFFYDVQIVARSGDAGINTIGGPPSVNDFGRVAFHASVPGGEGLFVAAGTTATSFTPNFVAANRVWSPFVQINNSRDVAARDRVTGNPAVFLIRRWSSDVPNANEVYERTTGSGFCNGGLRAGQPCVNNGDCPPDPLTGSVGVCVRGGTYDSLLFPSINNLGRIAFLGLIANSNFLVSGTSATSEVHTRVTAAFRPSLADDGRIVGRDGNTATSPIRLFSADLTSFEELANSAIFSELGRSPAISDDGVLVGFAGNRGKGRGVFVSFKNESGVRYTLSIAGENATPKPELGELMPGTPLFFADFDIDSRVGVVHRESGANGLEDDEILICIVATPNLAANNVEVGRQQLSFLATKGIWTIRGFIRRSGTDQYMFVRDRVLPVVQVGESLRPGTDPVLTDVSVHDALASASSIGSLCAHYVAFLANAGSQQFVVRAESLDCDLAPIEGGVRFQLGINPDLLPSTGDTPVVVVRIFPDLDANGDYTPGEPAALGLAPRGYNLSGKTTVYFTPPPYDPQWPVRQGGKSSFAVEVSTAAGRAVFPNSIVYTEDVVECMGAVAQGLKVAYGEAGLAAPLSAATLKPAAVKAGARAEGILSGVFRRAKPLSAAGGSDERQQLVTSLEELPWKLRDFLNQSRPPNTDFSAALRPITHGQTLHTPIEAKEEAVILTLGTGSLVLGKSDPSIELGGELTGGKLILYPADAMVTPVSAQEASGWSFSLSLDNDIGLMVDNLKNNSTRGVESVARRMSFPSVHLEGNSLPLQLDIAHLSHIYVNPHVFSSLPSPEEREPNGATILAEWIATAAYRVPLDGSANANNEAKAALVCRQSYAFSAPFAEFEVAHCLLAGQAFPQMTFSVSDPDGSLEGFPAARVEQRFALNPQEGTDAPDTYFAGLFRDIDYPEWYMDSILPVSNQPCQPVPFWWNMFEFSPNNVAPVSTEIIFDTDDSDTTYITPDNIHLHHAHKWLDSEANDFLEPFGIPLGGPNGPIVEAPGSFNGTFHLHWRWGKSYTGFGGGRALLPAGQVWVMGLARASFPERYDDFRDYIVQGVDISRTEKVFLLSCRQNQIMPGRQYVTMCTGFAYALGREGCALTDFTKLFGYYLNTRGYGNSPGAPFVRDSERKALQTVFQFQNNPLQLIIHPQLFLLSQLVKLYPLGQHCGDMTPPTPFREAFTSTAPLAVQTNCFVVNLDPSQIGLTAPLIVSNGLFTASFSSSPQTNSFIIAPAPFFQSAGAALVQRTGTNGEKLTVEFNTPILEIHNLPVAVGQTNGTAVVRIELYDGGSTVKTTNIECRVTAGQPTAQTLVKLQPGVAFTKLTVESIDVSKRVALGSFVATRIHVPTGDLNYDGKVDSTDVQLFGAGYSGQGQLAAPWFSEADLDGDSDVDDQDYAAMITLLGTNAPLCPVLLRAAPPATAPGVLSGGRAIFSGEAIDLRGAPVAYQWSATEGTVTGGSSNQMEWIAPQVSSSAPIPVSFQLSVFGIGGCGTNYGFTRLVLPNTFSNWIASTLGPFRQDARLQDDEDGDGINNFLEWVLGFDPEKKDLVRDRLWYGIIEQNGRRYLQLNVIKRKDLVDARLTASVSTNLSFWQSGTDAVDVLPPIDLGDSLEQVSYRDKLPADVSPSRFLRLVGSQDMTLNIQHLTAGVQISWPDRGYPMRLEVSTNLGSSAWQSIKGVVSLDGVASASITNLSSQQFFRLVSP